MGKVSPSVWPDFRQSGHTLKRQTASNTSEPGHAPNKRQKLENGEANVSPGAKSPFLTPGDKIEPATFNRTAFAQKTPYHKIPLYRRKLEIRSAPTTAANIEMLMVDINLLLLDAGRGRDVGELDENYVSWDKLCELLQELDIGFDLSGKDILMYEIKGHEVYILEDSDFRDAIGLLYHEAEQRENVGPLVMRRGKIED